MGTEFQLTTNGEASAMLQEQDWAPGESSCAG